MDFVIQLFVYFAWFAVNQFRSGGGAGFGLLSGSGRGSAQIEVRAN